VYAGVAARYELRERIAAGGMGIIFRAHDTLGERDVAFKRLNIKQEQHAAQLTALFEREFHTLVQLAHPGIVEAYDYGIDDAGPYYTMELLSGTDLSVGAPLAIGQVCKILYEVSSALALVHARRLVHRDLSPANVLLTNTGRAKLIDFGALAPFGRRPQQIVGTPAFIAPECLGDGEIDQRADLYALGALAYWLLTGTRAIRASNLRELQQAWTRELVPVTELAPDVPKALEDLVLSLLQVEPLARPSSAAYVMDRLSSITNSPPEEDEQRVAFSYVTYPPLVGRADVLSEFEEVLRESAGGRGSSIWIEAEQGLGRSALLRHFALRAQLAGATVVHAHGGAQRSALSLARVLVATALRAHPDLRNHYEREHAAMTAFALASAEGARPRPTAVQTPATAVEGYAELLSSMQQCLHELSQRNPLVLLVDDVHLADPESLGLLVSLAHEAHAHAISLLTSASSEELDAGAKGLSKLSMIARHLQLTPLSEASVVQLVASLFGDVPNSTRLARWLYAQSAGNLQRTLDLLRILLQRQIVRYRAGMFSLPYDVGTEVSPSGLTRVSLARFEGLSASARRIVQLLSLEEQALDLRVLSAALRLDGRSLLAAIDELVKRGVVTKTEAGITFASRALRAATAGELDAELERHLHLELARAILDERSSSAEQRIVAGFHQLKGGLRDQGAETLAASAVEIAFKSEGIAKAVPALEQALEVYRAQGRPEVACLPLLVPLTVAGFYGDPRHSVQHLERTYQALLEVSGTTLAARLTRFLGGKLALLIGFVYSFFVHMLMKRSARAPHLSQVFTWLFGVATAGAASMTCAYDQERTLSIGRKLSPFGALGPHTAAAVVRELCQCLAEIMLSVQADCAARVRRVIERLSQSRRILGLDPEVRAQLLLGAVYLRGISEVYAGDPVVLELADQLQQSGRAFSKPRAALLRMCHYGFRGEQAAADAHRATAEVLALLGGTLWSAMSAMAIRQLVMYQWTRDSVGLLRVVNELESFLENAPALGTHRDLAQACLELLRGRPDRALAVYERVLGAPRPHPVVNWQSESALHAAALNALGRHEEARQVCLQVVSITRDVDRRMRFLYQPALQELAISEALLGDVCAAAARLERLIEELEPLGNPLLLGSVHRDRCRVALLAKDSAGFERHLLKMNGYFRATQNPCLIQQCEQLASEGTSAGLRAGLDAQLPPSHAATSAMNSSLTTIIEDDQQPTVVVSKRG
jgi:Protein kinase domain/AAA ATPase domain